MDSEPFAIPHGDEATLVEPEGTEDDHAGTGREGCGAVVEEVGGGGGGVEPEGWGSADPEGYYGRGVSGGESGEEDPGFSGWEEVRVSN